MTKANRKTADSGIIRGDDGRAYRRQSDGRLAEIFDACSHAARQLEGLTAAHCVSALRFIDPARPEDPAVIVHLSPDEAKPVLALAREILKARAAG